MAAFAIRTTVSMPVVTSSLASGWSVITVSTCARMGNCLTARGLSSLMRSNAIPRTNDGWFEVKRRTFGGEDGVEFLDANQLEAMIAATPNARHLGITFDEDSMELFIIEWS